MSTPSAASTASAQMTRHEFLRGLHELVQPRTYLETGIQKGRSITLSRAPSIGIDPEFAIESELLAPVHLARTSSDEFFARAHPLAALPRDVVDLAFIDGMHLAEYALRDYLAVERFTTTTSVLLFDDMLPKRIAQAARYRVSTSWTGDVYKAGLALREMCPELIVLEVDTDPTGVVLVLAPNAARDGVLPGYDDWLDEAVSPDPQPVPDEVLNRTRAKNPHRVLASPGWAELVALRSRRIPPPAAAIREAFGDVL